MDKKTKNKSTETEASRSERRIGQYKEAVNNLLNVFFDSHRAEDIYEELDGVWMTKAKDEKEKRALREKRLDLSGKLAHVKLYPWENLLHLALSPKEDITPIADLRESFIREYGPRTPTELALIEIMAISHYNFIRNSGVFNNHLMTKDGDSRTLHFYTMRMEAAEEAGKAVDMAYRQFTNSIALLKEIRQPKHE